MMMLFYCVVIKMCSFVVVNTDVMMIVTTKGFVMIKSSIVVCSPSVTVLIHTSCKTS